MAAHSNGLEVLEKWHAELADIHRSTRMCDTVRETRARAVTMLDSLNYDAQKQAIGAYFRAMADLMASDIGATMPDFPEREAERFIWQMSQVRYPRRHWWHRIVGGQ